MRHHIFSAAMGIAIAAMLVPVSATTAQAGDPSGYWRKADQGKFPAKMQLYRCSGRGICVKIVWLQNPRDSQGRVLQDVRNVNPALRKRTIEGMHIIRGMKQVSANQWKGTVYNPEDGKTYSATVTLASSRKIVLKGCVSFFCREQVWLRTSAPPPREEEKPEPTVEASAKPEAAPAVAAAPAAAAKPAAIAAAPKPVSTGMDAASLAQAAKAASAQGTTGASIEKAYAGNARWIQVPTSYTGDSVSSLFAMAAPLPTSQPQAAPQGAPAAPAQVSARPDAPPAPDARQASVQPEPAAAPPESEQPEAAAAAPSDEPAAEPVQSAPSAAEGQRLTWRERRQLRRQQRLKELQGQGQNFVPWMSR